MNRTSAEAQAQGGGEVASCQMTWTPKGMHEKVWTCRHCKTEVTRDGSSGHPFVRCVAPQPPAEAQAQEAHWKVGRFRSSHTPEQAVLVLSVGAAIERDEQHHSFIEWVYSHPVEAQAQGGEVVAWADASIASEVLNVALNKGSFGCEVPLYAAPPSAPVGVAFNRCPDDGSLVSKQGYRLAYGGVPGCWRVKPEDFPAEALAQQPAAVDGVLANLRDAILRNDGLTRKNTLAAFRAVEAALAAQPGGSDNE